MYMTMFIASHALLLFFFINMSFGQDYSLADETWYKFRSIDDICQPSRLGFKSYTGFRIQHQIISHLPNIHHTRLTYCSISMVAGAEAYYPTSQGDELAWGKKFCQTGRDSNSMCFIMARTKKMAYRETAFFVRNTLVGAIFQCPGHMIDDEHECTNENARPLYPLYADDFIFSWYEFPDIRHGLYRMPMIASQDADNREAVDIFRAVRDHRWFREIDIHENYNYTKDEALSIRRAYSGVYKTFAKYTHVPFRLYFPTTKSVMADKGDGVQRRPLYAKPPRYLFQGQAANDYHVAPFVQFNQTLARRNTNINNNNKAIMAMKQFNRPAQNNANSKLMIPRIHQLFDVIGSISPAEWNKFKQHANDLLEMVNITAPDIDHLDKPKNTTRYLLDHMKRL